MGHCILNKLQDYVMDVDNTLVADAIRAIGRVAQVVPEATERCLSTLMTFMNSDHGSVCRYYSAIWSDGKIIS